MANKRRPAPKKAETKKVDVKKYVSIALTVFLVLSITLSTLFVIDSFAPANPKVYDRWVLSTFHGSYDGKDTPNSYYQIEIQKNNDTGEVLYSCVDLKISTWNARPIKEIWINISDLYEQEVNIFLGKGTAGATKLLKDITLTASDINKDKDGWFKLYSNKNGLDYNVQGFYGELKIGFSANVKLREVVVIDSQEGELFSTITVEGCSLGKKPSKAANGNDVTVTHNDKFDPITVGNVVDEQDKFPFVDKHTEEEEEDEHAGHNH